MSTAEGEEKSQGKCDDPDEQAQRQILNLFLGTARKHFGDWKEIFSGVKDERQAKKTLYPMEAILFTGVLLFLCQLGSRRQINHKLRGNGAVRRKYRALFGVEEIPHGDTLNYTYRHLKVAEVQEIVCGMMEKLMGQEELQKWRLFDMYSLIAMDGTGVLTYHERHCEYCLTRKLNNGTICYYHLTQVVLCGRALPTCHWFFFIPQSWKVE